MKHLNCLAPALFSLFLVSACASNSDEHQEEVEVLNEEPVSIEISIPEDSATATKNKGDEAVNQEEVPSVEGENSKSSVPAKTSQELTNQGTTKGKKASTVSINRSVGVKLSKESEFDLMSFAAEEVAILKKEACEGENCGSKVQLQSYNSEKTIVAVVLIKWREGSDKKNELREYKLKPESLLDIGCTNSCDAEGGKYNWKIVSAKYN